MTTYGSNEKKFGGLPIGAKFIKFAIDLVGLEKHDCDHSSSFNHMYDGALSYPQKSKIKSDEIGSIPVNIL